MQATDETIVELRNRAVAELCGSTVDRDTVEELATEWAMGLLRGCTRKPEFALDLLDIVNRGVRLPKHFRTQLRGRLHRRRSFLRRRYGPLPADEPEGKPTLNAAELLQGLPQQWQKIAIARLEGKKVTEIAQTLKKSTRVVQLCLKRMEPHIRRCLCR